MAQPLFKPNPNREPQSFLYSPEVIRHWETRAGNILDPQVQNAWSWLVQHGGGFPGKAFVRLKELADYFGRADGNSARQWVDTLECEGLVSVLVRHRGRHGGLELRILDPHIVAGGRPRRAPPQKEFDCVAELDEPEDQSNVLEIRSAAPGCASDCLPPEEVCAAGDDDRLPALLAAAKSHLGEDMFRVWLEPCRFEFPAADGPVICFAPTDFQRGYLARSYRRQVAECLAQIGQSGPLEFAVDESLRVTSQTVNPHPSTRQGADLTGVRNKGTTTNQGTQGRKEGTDLENLENRELRKLGNEAAALYDRLNDPSMYFWIAIAAAVTVREGWLTLAAVADLEASASADFASALKARLGSNWPKLRRLKSLLAQHGIKWRRQWERGRPIREEFNDVPITAEWGP
jgi:hypothetical protein